MTTGTNIYQDALDLEKRAKKLKEPEPIKPEPLEPEPIYPEDMPDNPFVSSWRNTFGDQPIEETVMALQDWMGANEQLPKTPRGEQYSDVELDIRVTEPIIDNFLKTLQTVGRNESTETIIRTLFPTMADDEINALTTSPDTLDTNKFTREELTGDYSFKVTLENGEEIDAILKPDFSVWIEGKQVAILNPETGEYVPVEAKWYEKLLGGALKTLEVLNAPMSASGRAIFRTTADPLAKVQYEQYQMSAYRELQAFLAEKGVTDGRVPEEYKDTARAIQKKWDDKFAADYGTDQFSAEAVKQRYNKLSFWEQFIFELPANILAALLANPAYSWLGQVAKSGSLGAKVAAKVARIPLSFYEFGSSEAGYISWGEDAIKEMEKKLPKVVPINIDALTNMLKSLGGSTTKKVLMNPLEKIDGKRVWSLFVEVARDPVEMAAMIQKAVKRGKVGLKQMEQVAAAIEPYAPKMANELRYIVQRTVDATPVIETVEDYAKSLIGKEYVTVKAIDIPNITSTAQAEKQGLIGRVTDVTKTSLKFDNGKVLEFTEFKPIIDWVEKFGKEKPIPYKVAEKLEAQAPDIVGIGSKDFARLLPNTPNKPPVIVQPEELVSANKGKYPRLERAIESRDIIAKKLEKIKSKGGSGADTQRLLNMAQEKVYKEWNDATFSITEAIKQKIAPKTAEPIIKVEPKRTINPKWDKLSTVQRQDIAKQAKVDWKTVNRSWEKIKDAGIRKKLEAVIGKAEQAPAPVKAVKVETPKAEVKAVKVETPKAEVKAGKVEAPAKPKTKAEVKAEQVKEVLRQTDPAEDAEVLARLAIDDIKSVLDEGKKGRTVNQVESMLDELDEDMVEGIEDVRAAIDDYRDLEREGLTPEEFADEKLSLFEEIQNSLDNLEVIAVDDVLDSSATIEKIAKNAEPIKQAIAKEPITKKVPNTVKDKLKAKKAPKSADSMSDKQMRAQLRKLGVKESVIENLSPEQVKDIKENFWEFEAGRPVLHSEYVAPKQVIQLQKLGYSPKMIDKMKFNEAEYILTNKITPDNLSEDMRVALLERLGSKERASQKAYDKILEDAENGTLGQASSPKEAPITEETIKAKRKATLKDGAKAVKEKVKLERIAGKPKMTKERADEIIKNFGIYLTSEAPEALRKLQLSVQKVEQTKRIAAFTEKYHKLLDTGMPEREAYSEAGKLLSGTYAEVYDEYLRTYTQEMADALVAKIDHYYNSLPAGKKRDWDFISTRTALLNALGGKTIPREVRSLKGSTAYKKLVEVFADTPEMMKTIETAAEEGSTLEDIMDGARKAYSGTDTNLLTFPELDALPERIAGGVQLGLFDDTPMSLPKPLSAGKAVFDELADRVELWGKNSWLRNDVVKVDKKTGTATVLKESDFAPRGDLVGRATEAFQSIEDSIYRAKFTKEITDNEARVLLEKLYNSGGGLPKDVRDALGLNKLPTEEVTTAAGKTVPVTQGQIPFDPSELPPKLQHSIIRTLKDIGLTPVGIGQFIRANLTSFYDMSWVARQQGAMVPSHFKEFMQSNPDAIRSFWRQDVADAAWSRIQNSPLYHYYAQSKYDFLRPLHYKKGTGRWKMADEFGNIGLGETKLERMTEKLPWVKASQRAFVTGTNGMNWAMFQRYYDELLETQKRILSGDVKLKAGETFNMQKELDDYAEFLSNMTGRAYLGENFSKAIPFINNTFFAPRLVMGRILSVRHLRSKNPRIMKEAWKTLGSFVGLGTASLMAGDAMGLWEVETDPRSADFMKVRIGNTRIDPWGGYQQLAVLVARMAMTAFSPVTREQGYKSSTTGKVSSRLSWDLLTSFMRGKFAPVPAAIVDFATAQTAGHEKVDVTSINQWAERLMPISIQDMYAAIQDDPSGWYTALPSFLGFGLQTYTGDWEENEKRIGYPKFEDNLQYGQTVPVYDTQDFYVDTASQFTDVNPAELSKQKGYSDIVRAVVGTSVMVKEMQRQPNYKLKAINPMWANQWQDREKIVASGDKQALDEYDARYPNAKNGNITDKQYYTLMMYNSIRDPILKEEYLEKHPELENNPRVDWLKSNPTENANLAIFGQADLLTYEAYTKAKSLADSLNIPASATEAYIPPENVAKDFFSYRDYVEQYGANSAEAKLVRANNEALTDYLRLSNEDLDDIDTPIKALEISVKYRPQDEEIAKFGDEDSAEYIEDKKERADAVKAYYKANPEYARADRVRDAWNANIPESFIEKYADYYLATTDEKQIILSETDGLSDAIGVDMPEHPAEFYKINIKWEKEDDYYASLAEVDSPNYIEDKEERATTRKAFMLMNTEYQNDSRRREAYEKDIPEEYIEEYVTYYSLPETPTAIRKQWLLNHPEYYNLIYRKLLKLEPVTLSSSYGGMSTIGRMASQGLMTEYVKKFK